MGGVYYLKKDERYQFDKLWKFIMVDYKHVEFKVEEGGKTLITKTDDVVNEDGEVVIPGKLKKGDEVLEVNFYGDDVDAADLKNADIIAMLKERSWARDVEIVVKRQGTTRKGKRLPQVSNVCR